MFSGGSCYFTPGNSRIVHVIAIFLEMQYNIKRIALGAAFVRKVPQDGSSI